jgi:alkaline phosphatase
MSRMPVQGATTTYSLNSIITDSAPRHGPGLRVKTFNGGIGVDGQGKPVPSMAEMARDQGWKVGVVTSVSLDHATPASFYAHQPTRNNYYEIALDLAGSGFHYFAGGGFKDPAGKKSKKQGDKENALSVIQFNGYTVVNTREAILALRPGAARVVAINPELDEDKACPMRWTARARASPWRVHGQGHRAVGQPKGFFLMVEGARSTGPATPTTP